MIQWTRRRPSSALLGVLGVVLGLVGNSPATAGEWAFVGARYQGMGGAGVATVNDSFASYWNPAALGYAQSYDVALNADIMATAEGDIIRTIDELEDLVGSSEFDTLVTQLEADMGLDAGATATLADLEAQLLELGATEDGVIGNTTGGFGLRVWVLSLDLAAGYSPNKVDVRDGDTFASRVNASAVLAVRGKF
ncbi:MAG: hypothetical protein IH973_04210 [Myxococcales bacterium]|nr:hypothetical protein [Myxococcales bacterium]